MINDSNKDLLMIMNIVMMITMFSVMANIIPKPPIPPAPPSHDAAISTDVASDITSETVTLNGTLVSFSTASPASQDVNFEYGINANYGTVAIPATMTVLGPFSALLAGLTPDTMYHYRAFAGNIKGVDMAFSTSAAPVLPFMWTCPYSDGLQFATLDLLISHVAADHPTLPQIQKATINWS